MSRVYPNWLIIRKFYLNLYKARGDICHTFMTRILPTPRMLIWSDFYKLTDLMLVSCRIIVILQ